MEEQVTEAVGRCTVHSNEIARAFCEGGSVMYMIAFVGLMALGIIIERFLTLQKMNIDKKTVTENIFGLILRGDIKQAVAYCDSRRTPLTYVLKSGMVLALNKRPDEEIQVAMDAAVIEETPKIEGWTSFLAVFGNAAVLIGLLGTVFGLIASFRGITNADPAQKAQILSAGISEALNCTAFGLLVAVISIIAFGYFQMRIGKISNDVLESSMKIMNLVCANRDKIKY